MVVQPGALDCSLAWITGVLTRSSRHPNVYLVFLLVLWFPPTSSKQATRNIKYSDVRDVCLYVCMVPNLHLDVSHLGCLAPRLQWMDSGTM